MDRGKFWTLITHLQLVWNRVPHLSDTRLGICVDQLVTVSLFPITLGCELCLLIRMDGKQVWQFLNSYWDIIAPGYKFNLPDVLAAIRAIVGAVCICTLFWVQLSIAAELGMHNESVSAALTNLNWSWKASRSDKLSKNANNESRLHKNQTGEKSQSFQEFWGCFFIFLVQMLPGKYWNLKFSLLLSINQFKLSSRLIIHFWTSLLKFLEIASCDSAQQPNPQGS